jgi:hypothetical protein
MRVRVRTWGADLRTAGKASNKGLDKGSDKGDGNGWDEKLGTGLRTPCPASAVAAQIPARSRSTRCSPLSNTTTESLLISRTRIRALPLLVGTSPSSPTAKERELMMASR